MCNTPSPSVGLPKLTQTVRLSLADLQTSLLPTSKGSRFPENKHQTYPSAEYPDSGCPGWHHVTHFAPRFRFRVQFVRRDMQGP